YFYTSSVTVTVKGTNNQPLSLVEITLTDVNNNLVAKKNTAENGVVIFESLEPGTYYITQTSSIEGYESSKDIIEFKIETGYENLSFDIINTKVLSNSITVTVKGNDNLFIKDS